MHFSHGSAGSGSSLGISCGGVRRLTEDPNATLMRFFLVAKRPRPSADFEAVTFLVFVSRKMVLLVSSAPFSLCSALKLIWLIAFADIYSRSRLTMAVGTNRPLGRDSVSAPSIRDGDDWSDAQRDCVPLIFLDFSREMRQEPLVTPLSFLLTLSGRWVCEVIR